MRNPRHRNEVSWENSQHEYLLFLYLRGMPDITQIYKGGTEEWLTRGKGISVIFIGDRKIRYLGVKWKEQKTLGQESRNDRGCKRI